MKKLLMLIILALLLAACGGGGGDPVATVETYLQAKAEGDATTIRQLLCSELESVAEREALTFESVSDVRLVDMSCSQVGGKDVVVCDGQFLATYGAEETAFPLTSYRIVQEDGEYKWCGEAAP